MKKAKFTEDDLNCLTESDRALLMEMKRDKRISDAYREILLDEWESSNPLGARLIKHAPLS